MKHSKYKILMFLSLGFALVLPPLPADTVVLNNGQRYEGKILEETASQVVLQDYRMRLTLPKTRVVEIIRSAPGDIEVTFAARAIELGDYERATSLLAEAIELGSESEMIEELQTVLFDKQVEKELRQYEGLIATVRETSDLSRQGEILKTLKTRFNEVPDDSPIREALVQVICEVSLRRASLFVDRVDYRSAIAELNTVINLDPTLAQPFLDLGDLYRRTNETLNIAIDNYLKALELNTNDQLSAAQVRHIHFQLGELYRQSSRWATAADHYEIVYKQDPRYDLRLEDRLVDCFIRGAEALRFLQPEQALEVANRGLVVRQSPQLFNLKANIQRNLEDFTGSNETFRRLLEIQPRTQEAHYTMAKNYFDMGETLSGREALRREVEVFPNNIEALLDLGDMALQRDAYNEARDYYSRIHRVDSDEPRASLGLGKTARRSGNLPEARRFVQRVLDDFPSNREANLEMGRILRDENRLEEAMQYFTRVLELIDQADDSERQALVQLRADALIARGEIRLLTTGPGTAQSDFRQALDILPDYPAAYFAIGNAFRRRFAASNQLSDLRLAEENTLTAHNLSPENPEYALSLGILYHQNLAQADPNNKNHYHAQAIQYYRTYIELGGADRNTVNAWIREIGG